MKVKQIITFFNRQSAIFLGLLIIIVVSSCVPQKRLIYLQDKTETDTVTQFTNTKPIYKIKIGDQLYVKVLSLDRTTYEVFNMETSRGLGANALQGGMYLQSYTVSDSGDIELPIIGKVNVGNLSVDQVREKIQERINEYLYQTIVIIRLVSFRISILGEVGSPGNFFIFDDEINLFQALSLAGDIRDYGNRERVTIIRKTDKGTQINYIDLTSKEILGSDYYHLRPEDIIYIEPLKAKRFRTQDLTILYVIFSSISTLILMLNTFNYYSK